MLALFICVMLLRFTPQHNTRLTSGCSVLSVSPFDLHVLSTPPAFVLSQDQTLHKIIMKNLDGSLYIEIVVPCGTCFGAKSTAHLALTSFLMHYLHCSVFREHIAAVADSFYILAQPVCCVNIFFLFSSNAFLRSSNSF